MSWSALVGYFVTRRKWGLLAMLLTLVLAFLAAIWGVAHVLTPEGGTISVFHGLVEYPKGNALGRRCPPEHSRPLAPRRIAHSATVPSMKAALRKFHQQEQLLDLSTLDTGKPLAEMPIGTYGFISGATLDPKVKRLVAEDGVQAAGVPWGTKFEVQKNLQGELSIVAFVSASDSERAMRPAAAARDITLLPRPLKGECDLLIIPEAALESAAIRTIQLKHDEEMVVIDARLVSSNG